MSVIELVFIGNLFFFVIFERVSIVPEFLYDVEMCGGPLCVT